MSSHGRNSLSSSAAGRMNSSLLRSEPTAILLMIGSSRSAATPWTYCGVTAVSSTTTPAAFTLARPGGGTDVVDRGRRQPGQRGDVVEEGEQAAAHGGHHQMRHGGVRPIGRLELSSVEADLPRYAAA